MSKYSVILLAMVDHRYRFRYTNFGSPGRCHDDLCMGDLHSANSPFKRPKATIEGGPVPSVVLCDQVFALSQNLRKPYASTLHNTQEPACNYNLSRTGRVAENVFRRMKARFCFVMKCMKCRINTTTLTIRACFVLHNICAGFQARVEPYWEQEVTMWDAAHEQPARTSDVCSGNGLAVRQVLAKYFL